MPTIGKINTLLIVEKVADGIYLDGAELEEIFLPYGNVSKDVQEGDKLDVFLYLDSEDVVIATAEKPNALVGDCALLKVLSVGKFGAFLDWGIGKDLLLPHSEQAFPVEEGRSYLVYVLQDKRSGRIAATTKFHFHFEESSGPYKIGEQVDLLIAAKTELGYKAIFNDHYLGLIHAGDLRQPLAFGERIKGWIKSVRDDGKVDLSINTLDNETRSELEQQVLDQLNASENGTLALSDKSPADEIYKAFKVSKKNFKRAVGGLYKKRLILVEQDLIRLSGNTEPFIEKRKFHPRGEPQAESKKASSEPSKHSSGEVRSPYKSSPYKKSQTNTDSKSLNKSSSGKPYSYKPKTESSTRDAERFKSSLLRTEKPSESAQKQPYGKASPYGKSSGVELKTTKAEPAITKPNKIEPNKKTKTEHVNAHIYQKGKSS